MYDRFLIYKKLNEKYLFDMAEIGKMFKSSRQYISFMLNDSRCKELNLDEVSAPEQLPNSLRSIAVNLITSDEVFISKSEGDINYDYYLCESYDPNEVSLLCIELDDSKVSNAYFFLLPDELKQQYRDLYEGYRKDDYRNRKVVMMFIDKCREQVVIPRLSNVKVLLPQLSLAIKYARSNLQDKSLQGNGALKVYLDYLIGYDFNKAQVLNSEDFIQRTLSVEMVERKSVDGNISNQRCYPALSRYIQNHNLNVTPIELLKQNGYTVRKGDTHRILGEKWLWVRRAFLLNHFGISEDTIYLPISSFYHNLANSLRTKNVTIDDMCTLMNLKRVTKRMLPTNFIEPKSYPSRFDLEELQGYEIDYIIQKLLKASNVIKVSCYNSDFTRLKYLLKKRNLTLDEILENYNSIKVKDTSGNRRGKALDIIYKSMLEG